MQKVLGHSVKFVSKIHLVVNLFGTPCLGVYTKYICLGMPKQRDAHGTGTTTTAATDQVSSLAQK